MTGITVTASGAYCLSARAHPVCRRARGCQGGGLETSRVGVGHLWSGRKKACGAVEQKKTPKQERKRLGVLRSWRAIRLGTKRGAVWKGLDKGPAHIRVSDD